MSTKTTAPPTLDELRERLRAGEVVEPSEWAAAEAAERMAAVQAEAERERAQRLAAEEREQERQRAASAVDAIVSERLPALAPLRDKAQQAISEYLTAAVEANAELQEACDHARTLGVKVDVVGASNAHQHRARPLGDLLGAVEEVAREQLLPIGPVLDLANLMQRVRGERV